jgi:hypothetical protein
MIKKDLKDWQVAMIMFGKNTKKECKLVGKLRKNGIIEELCDGYSIIMDKNLKDDCGWIIPNECLE